MNRTFNNIINTKASFLVVVCLFLLFMNSCRSDRNEGQGEEYQKTGRVHGTIKISGSVTMNNLLSLWCRGFSNVYPDVTCIVESYGSHMAPIDLTNKNADIGMMSDSMTIGELKMFREKNGYDPVGFRVAFDMIGVFVSKDNPLECISIAELDGIYSSDYKCPDSKEILTWGELGLEQRWQNVEIVSYGRNPASGTYDAFRKIALCDGQYKDTVRKYPNSQDIVDFVSDEAQSIGYSGIAYLSSDIKALNIGSAEQGCYPPEYEYAFSGKYPLKRYLWLYTREHKREEKYILVREFLKYVMSSDGQKYIRESGHNMLPEDIYSEEKAKIEQFEEVNLPSQ